MRCLFTKCVLVIVFHQHCRVPRRFKRTPISKPKGLQIYMHIYGRQFVPALKLFLSHSSISQPPSALLVSHSSDSQPPSVMLQLLNFLQDKVCEKLNLKYAKSFDAKSSNPCLTRQKCVKKYPSFFHRLVM